jgi:hypothetical protein
MASLLLRVLGVTDAAVSMGGGGRVGNERLRAARRAGVSRRNTIAEIAEISGFFACIVFWLSYHVFSVRWRVPLPTLLSRFLAAGDSEQVLDLLRPLVRLKTRVLLALLAGALLAPSAARAGCDSVTHIEKMRPATKGALPTPASPSQPCPCTGPTCSRAPFVPAAPPVVVTLRLPDWVCPGPPLSLAPSFSTSPVAADEPLPPVRQGATIYRPPRPLA